MIDLGAIALQTRNQAALFEGRVYGAADLPTAEDYLVKGAASMPAAFVVPLAETPTDNDFDSCIVQEVTYRFGVLAALSPSKHKTLGKAGWDQVAPARTAVLKSLLGWTPEGESSPITYAGGELQKLTRAVLAYRFDFELVGSISQENDGWQPGDLPMWDGAHVDYLLDPDDEPVAASDDVDRNFE
jgi:hypothetical protein